MPNNIKKILGIDPGTVRIGYGLIEKNGGKLSLIKSGLLNIVSTEKIERLYELEKDFQKLLKETKPDLVALEKLYFLKNKKTALDVAEARGILLVNVHKAGIPLVEFSPPQVKSAVAGYGKADKSAVAKMAARFLGMESIDAIDDVTDAIAIAIAASNNRTGLTS